MRLFAILHIEMSNLPNEKQPILGPKEGGFYKRPVVYHRNEELPISISRQKGQTFVEEDENCFERKTARSFDSGVEACREGGSLYLSSPTIVFIVLAFVGFLAFIGKITMELALSNNCVGVPYLYVTGHDWRNVMKISRDGCVLALRTLWFGGVQIEKMGAPGFRGLAMGTYKKQSALYVADSPNSAVLVFSSCSHFLSHGMRVIQSVAISGKNDDFSGAHHPYAISFDLEGNMYVSFQHTNSLLRYKADTFEPMPFPPYLNPTFGDKNITSTALSPLSPSSSVNASTLSSLSSLSTSSTEGDSTTFNDILGSRPSTTASTYFNGTFIQFGLPGFKSDDDMGIRGHAWVHIPLYGYDSYNHEGNKGTVASFVKRNMRSMEKSGDGGPPYSPTFSSTLWVANEDYNKIYIFSKEGKLENKIKIAKPIAVYYNHDEDMGPYGLVFVSSKAKKKEGGGAVFGIDPRTLKIVKTYTLIGMTHPTGIQIYDGVLFVNDQSLGAILTFDVISQRFLKQIYAVSKNDGADQLEGLLLSNC